MVFPAGPYTQHVDEHRAWNFILDAAGLRDGWNEIVLYNDAAAALSVIVVEVGLFSPA